jgi:hypothetical protein
VHTLLHPIHPIYFQFYPFHCSSFCINRTPYPALLWRATILYSPKIPWVQVHLHLQWVLFVVCDTTLSIFSGNSLCFKTLLVVRAMKSTTTDNRKLSHILITSDNIQCLLWHCSSTVLVFHEKNNWFCWQCMINCGTLTLSAIGMIRERTDRLAGYFVCCVVRV